MATINLTSNSGTGFLKSDFDQLKDALQDSGSDISVGSIQSTDLTSTGSIQGGTGSFTGSLYGYGGDLDGLSAGGISNIVEDTTPQLGGDLDLNSKNIGGTGSINASNLPNHVHNAGSLTSGTVPDARISSANVTQHEGDIDHDALTNYVANEHLNWTAATSPFSTSGSLQVLSNGSFTGSVIASGYVSSGSYYGYGGTLDGIGVLNNIVEDSTPQLGGDLDINSKNIGGTGSIHIVGDIKGVNGSFVGSLVGGSYYGWGGTLDGTGGLSNIVEDTTPQLGGDLDLNNFNIGGTGSINAANLPNHVHNAGSITSGIIPDARIQASGVTQHEGSIDHDALNNYVADEHIDWTSSATDFSTSGSLQILDSGSFTGSVIASTFRSSGSYYGWGGTLDGTGGLSNVVEDTTPQLGGDLDINSKNIGGTGSILLVGDVKGVNGSFTGSIVASSFIGTLPNHVHNAGSITSGTLPDARIQSSGVTQHEGDINHDALTNYVAAEHVDWAASAVDFSTSGSLQVLDNGSFVGSVIAGSFIGYGGDLTGLAGGGTMNDLIDDTTPQLGGDLDLNGNNVYDVTGSLEVGNIILTGSPATDHDANGIAVTLTAGVSVVFGDVCSMDPAGNLIKANNSSVDTVPGLYMSIDTTGSDASGKFLRDGFARDDTWTWGVGSLVYVDNTAGALTQTVPNVTGSQVQVVGLATHADRLDFRPSPVIVEVS